MRADVFIAKKYPQFARSALKLLFKQGNVQLEGQIVKPGYKLKYGDKLTVNASILSAKPEVDLPIIYEDEDVVVINKPSGILTHSKGTLNLEPTVAAFLAHKITDRRLSGNRAGIVHRLDRYTSGLIIGAKNANSLQKLQKQFISRKVKKTYVAIVEGRLSPPSALIDAPITRNSKRPQTFKVSSTGKSAQTEYRTLRKFSKDGKDFSVVKLMPITGRTHQLRVHMAYIGHPIVGDKIYGRNGQPLLLHAQKLELTLPNGSRRIFSAPIPQRFKEFIQK